MLIDFAREGLEEEFFLNLVPEARALVMDFALASKESKWPKPVVTGLSREPEWYRKNNLPEPAFSWHYRVEDPAFKDLANGAFRWFTSAVDLRNVHYSHPQYGDVLHWFTQRCPAFVEGGRPGRWEFISRLHGTGPHLHIAFRDARLRRLYVSQHRKDH